jgi:SNF2 family DNA or RNA helicase
MEKLIIIITHKKKLGNIIIPYIASTDNLPSITLLEQAVPNLFEKSEYSFSDKEKEIIEILYNINEKTIFKIFSKDKTLKIFYDKLSKDFADTHIRPYIEKNITKALNVLAEHDIEFYYKDPKYSQIYETDLVVFHKDPAEALFQFDLTEEGLTYSLRIFSQGKKILLRNQDIIELTADPASMLINSNLYRFENIDIKKFRPFKEKSFITIPQRSVDTYMSSFVKINIERHKVEVNGFTVAEEQVKPKAFLSIEPGLSHNTVLILKLKYKDLLFPAARKTDVFVNYRKEGSRYVFTKLSRDKEWEKSIKHFLTEELNLKETNSYYIPASVTSQTQDSQLYAIIRWLNSNSEAIKNKGIGIIQNSDDKKYFTGKTAISFDFSEDKDWFDINASVTVGDTKIPFYKLRKNIINGQPEYKLPDGKIFIIPREWFTKYSDILYHTETDGEKLKLKKVFFNLLNFEHKTETRSLPDKLRSFYSEANTGFGLPEGINARLRPYQAEGYSWLYLLHKNHFGGILADDMGLGKTLQTIALLVKMYENNDKAGSDKNKTDSNASLQLSLFDNYNKFNKTGIAASIIVLPTSLVYNWRNELKRFAPQLKIYIYTGANRLKTKDISKILRHYHIVLTTYGIVRNDIEYLKTYKFHYSILDESQYIKNPSSITYSAVMELNSEHKLVLTGTPIENSLTDLWAQMNFVNPGLLGNFNRFKQSYIKPIIKGKNEETEQKLKLLINPFILRRTKEMVAKDLPPITEQVIYCNMTEEQKKIYEREKSGVRNELLSTFNNSKKNSIKVLQALTRLRQIANHPVLVEENYTGSSGKFEQIMSGLQDIVSENHKVLVFSSFVKNLELIETKLKEQNIIYSKLTGSTTNREKVIKQFTGNDNCRIFLISLKAGGVGLNLVEADYVFMLNPWWNPAAEAQAVNRAHRIGQTKNVFVYKFLANETIEEKIANLQKKKQKLADTFITTENMLKNLTKDEFEKLLT